jgi:hypothetical protein
VSRRKLRRLSRHRQRETLRVKLYGVFLSVNVKSQFRVSTDAISTLWHRLDGGARKCKQSSSPISIIITPIKRGAQCRVGRTAKGVGN